MLLPKKLSYFLFILILPVFAFPACKGSYADTYCNCRCTLQYKIPADVPECCKYNWGGYGNDGDTNCCTAPKVWVKSKTTCLTPCTTVDCKTQQQNGQQYLETTGSCCQAAALKPYTETLTVVATCKETETTKKLPLNAGSITTITCNTTPVSKTFYRGGQIVYIKPYEDNIKCGLVLSNETKELWTGYYTFQGGTVISMPETCPVKTNDQICAGKNAIYTCLKPYTTPQCPTYFYGKCHSSSFSSVDAYLIQATKCAQAIISVTLLTCK